MPPGAWSRNRRHWPCASCCDDIVCTITLVELRHGESRMQSHGRCQGRARPSGGGDMAGRRHPQKARSGAQRDLHHLSSFTSTQHASHLPAPPCGRPCHKRQQAGARLGGLDVMAERQEWIAYACKRAGWVERVWARPSLPVVPRNALAPHKRRALAGAPLMGRGSPAALAPPPPGAVGGSRSGRRACEQQQQQRSGRPLPAAIHVIQQRRRGRCG